MTIIPLDIIGNVYVGNYAVSTEEIALVPLGTPKRKMDKIGEALGVGVHGVNIAASRLIGIFVAANSKGLLLPEVVEPEEVKGLKAVGVNPTIVHSKWTAWGNLVLTNDNGAVIDPRLPADTMRQISDALDVEAVKGEINRLTLVGSHAVATNNGIICDPRVRDEEIKILTEVLRVPVITGTVNNGLPHVRAGVVANSRGAVVGTTTTGPELIDLSQLFVE